MATSGSSRHTIIFSRKCLFLVNEDEQQEELNQAIDFLFSKPDQFNVYFTSYKYPSDEMLSAIPKGWVNVTSSFWIAEYSHALYIDCCDCRSNTLGNFRKDDSIKSEIKVERRNSNTKLKDRNKTIRTSEPIKKTRTKRPKLDKLGKPPKRPKQYTLYKYTFKKTV